MWEEVGLGVEKMCEKKKVRKKEKERERERS